jgi:hypothetical protein
VLSFIQYANALVCDRTTVVFGLSNANNGPIARRHRGLRRYRTAGPVPGVRGARADGTRTVFVATAYVAAGSELIVGPAGPTRHPESAIELDLGVPLVQGMLDLLFAVLLCPGRTGTSRRS